MKIIAMIVLSVGFWCTNPLFAQIAPAPKSPASKPEIIEIRGKKAYLYLPPQPAEGKPWIWYAPTIGGSVLIMEHRLYVDAFMKAGISIAGFDLGEVRGAPGSSEQFTAFYDEMVKRGFSKKPILLGQSRGGLMMLGWATRNPEKVQAWVGIYPVCNLTSWPLKSSKRATLADYGVTEEQLLARIKEFNPIENLAALAKERVPFFSVHGDMDRVVPLPENTQLLKEKYEALGGTCTVKVIPGEGHAVSRSFFECKELIDFIIQQIQKKP